PQPPRPRERQAGYSESRKTEGAGLGDLGDDPLRIDAEERRPAGMAVWHLDVLEGKRVAAGTQREQAGAEVAGEIGNIRITRPGAEAVDLGGGADEDAEIVDLEAVAGDECVGD